MEKSQAGKGDATKSLMGVLHQFPLGPCALAGVPANTAELSTGCGLHSSVSNHKDLPGVNSVGRIQVCISFQEMP